MKKYFLPLILVGVLLSGCSDEGGDSKREIISISRGEEKIVGSTNDFAMKLTVKIAETGLRDNFIVSPLSLSMALSMTANGAEGETRAEILNTLGFDADELKTANELNRTILEKFPSLDPKVKLSIANAIWLKEASGHEPSAGFVSALSDNYGPSFHLYPELSSLAVMDAINKWSSEHTSGMVPQVLNKPLPEKTMIALTNALYFDGKWASAFEKKNTRDQTFHNADGSESTVKMMSQDGLSAEAFKEDGYSAAAIRYGNTAYSLVVVLPDEGKDVVDVVRGIDSDDLRTLVDGGFYMCKLNLKLPRFEVESSFDMIPVLQELGINKAFTPKADFSAMWTPVFDGFGINLVRQASKIEVNEEGTKASATTVVSGGDLTAMPLDKVDFIVDRPFAFFIAERSTGVILFSGIVSHL